MAKIGFVGLGHMGLPMAHNLLKAGHEVTGLDLQPKAVEEFLTFGGKSAQTLQELAHGKDVVITMLQTGDQVKAVCGGDKGLFSNAAEGTLFIDSSSIDVESSREFHQLAHKHHFLSADAPVSGGAAGAKAGTLTFMVGGDEAAFLKAHEILLCMGKTIIHTGQEGSGQAAKICNNMILGISMIGISEAFVLAEKLGLSAKKLHEVVSNSSGQCWAIDKYVPIPNILDNVPANYDYQPGFTAAMMLKDLKLSQKSAKRAGAKTPMGHQAMTMYEQLSNSGMAELDFSAIIKLLQSNKVPK